MRVPSTNPITLPFGSADSPYSIASPHMGTDFGYAPDNRIYAPFAGKVTQVPNNGNDGNGTYMTEQNGNFHGMLHASKYLVPNGSQVSEGQPIAVMGDTGYAFGVHLHWCVKVNGQFIDPMSLITEEGEIMPDEGTVQNVVKELTGGDASKAQIDAYTKISVNDPTGIIYGYMFVEIDRIKNAANKPANGYTPYNGKQLFTED